MSQSWNPDLYLRYATYRARPALDLLGQIELNVDGPVYDLGCGPGNVTAKLKERWPERTVTGIDSSPDMLTKARAGYGDRDIAWMENDIGTWQPKTPAALVFSNAALHWVSDHHRVLPQLMNALASGGILAVQIPVTEDSAYQVCIRATVQSDRWRDKLAKVWMYKNPLTAEEHYDLLAPYARWIDIWETDYHHVLEGDNPVLEWITGTGLTPYLSVLEDAEKAEFLADYGARILAAYPKQEDRSTLFLMRRIFVLAEKR